MKHADGHWSWAGRDYVWKYPEQKGFKNQYSTSKAGFHTEMTRTILKSQTRTFGQVLYVQQQPGQRPRWAGQGWPLRNCRTWVKASTVALLASRDTGNMSWVSQSTSKSTQGKTRERMKGRIMSHGAEKRQVRQAPPSCPFQEKWFQEDPATVRGGLSHLLGATSLRNLRCHWKHFWPRSSQRRTDAKTTVLKRPVFIQHSHLQRLYLSTLCILSWNNLRAASHLGKEVSACPSLGCELSNLCEGKYQRRQNNINNYHCYY